MLLLAAIKRSDLDRDWSNSLYVRRNAHRDGVTCRICDRGPYVMLGIHLKRTHGMSRTEYLRRYPGAEMYPSSIKEALKQEAKERGLPRGSKRRPVCKRGHPLRGANVLPLPNGRRTCRQCDVERKRAWRRRANEKLGTRPCECGCGGEAQTPARFIKGHGARRTWARLDPAKAAEIRASSESAATLARRFGVARGTIWHIKSGRTWR